MSTNKQSIQLKLWALLEAAMNWISLIVISGTAGAMAGMPAVDSAAPASNQVVATAALLSFVLYAAYWIFYRTVILPLIKRRFAAPGETLENRVQS